MDRAIEREHQAAVYHGQPWPPERKPEAARVEPDAAAPGREPQPERAARLDELQAARTRLRAGSTRSGPSSTPAASTRRG
jgi:hypothetical protein